MTNVRVFSVDEQPDSVALGYVLDQQRRHVSTWENQQQLALKGWWSRGDSNP
jgi:hypothetical protein